MIKIISCLSQSRVNFVILFVWFIYFQAKKMVESAPVVIKGDIPKDEADKLVKTLEAAGGKAMSE